MTYLLASVYLLVLSALLGEWSKLGSHIHQVITELPLLLLLFWFFYQIQRPNAYRAWIALLPITVAYIAFDYFYIEFARTFRFSDLANVDELLEVLSIEQMVLFSMVLFVPMILIGLKLDLSKVKTFLAGGAFLAALASIILFKPKLFIKYVKVLSEGPVYEHTLLMDNGRFMGTLFLEARRQLAIGELNQLDEHLNVSHIQQTARVIKNRPDVHIVVMESLIFPPFLEGIEYKSDVLPVGFSKKYAKKVGTSLSPVFGGNTPRAEFEVICGVPSFSLVGSTEFNYIEKNGLACLPNILAQAGYRTIASNPYKPSYFNEYKAYQALGFKDINFLDEFSNGHKTYLDIPFPPIGYPTDDALFNKNIEYLKQFKSNSEQPVFNYLISLYGHTPHYLSQGQQEQVKIASAPEPYLERAINQSYYSFKALESYIEALHELNPNSIVIIVADHLPPLALGVKSYNKAKYLSNRQNSYMKVPALFFRNAEQLIIPENIRHFDWVSLILEELSGKEYCQQNSCFGKRKDYLPLYQSMMFKAIRGQND